MKNGKQSYFRIVEYKDHFRIQEKSTKNTYFCFLGLPFWVNGKEDCWNTILEDKSILGIRNCVYTEKYQFKTKQNCLELIADFYKYPIYHYF